MRRHLKPTNKAWRSDDTYIKVKGRWCYRYRAIDSTGATIDFLLSANRDADAAKRLFRKALSATSHPQPRVINTDLAPIYSSAIPAIKKEGRVKAKQGFREFHAARRTIQGYEAIHMIRKGQVRWVGGNDVRCQIRFIGKLFGLAV
jgi:transposase-like protein